MNIGQEIGSVQNFGMNILKADNQIDWENIQHNPWIKALKTCPQDAIWHAEGNVYIHTQMVAEALIALPEFALFSEVEQQILLYAALFHDIAKPICTFEEKGRIVSPKHAKVGEKVVRELLWNADFAFREAVCSLVRLHGAPLWALEKEEPNALVISASLRLKNAWLHALSKADVLGRICEDKADLLERVAYFKELCIENNCYEHRYQFENEHSRFHFFQKQANYPVTLFDDTAFTIILMSGLPGSGKDAYIQQYFKDLPVISLDDLREEHEVKEGDTSMQGKMISLGYEQAKEYCRKKQSFVWNTTNLSKMLRSRLINTLLPYNPRIEIVYIETDFKQNIQRRKGEISEKTLFKMQKMLDMPMLDEAYRVSYIRN